MKLNADFSQRVTVLPQQYKWVDSPIAGVKRMMLDRIGDEVARATSIVEYLPNSDFPSHRHDGGEEILVLAGEFADEHGRYPTGTYMRNPIGTGHTPSVGPDGAVIFVKLHQFDRDDDHHFSINTHAAEWRPGLVDGLQVMPLHEFNGEQVALVKWAPNTVFNAHTHFGGEEILVLEGSFYDEHGVYPKGSWLRSPHLSEHRPFTKDDGALIYVKTGHLPAA